jgi:F-type H+-transporting ATPase subunit epsilon
MTKTFKLKLIAPDGVKYEGEALEASLPTPDGQISILPDHMPVISLLSPGEIVLKTSGKEHFLVTEGGVVEISNNLVKILADSAESAESLDQVKIDEAKKKAEASMANAKTDVEFADATAALEKQLAKIRVLKKRKKYR